MSPWRVENMASCCAMNRENCNHRVVRGEKFSTIVTSVKRQDTKSVIVRALLFGRLVVNKAILMHVYLYLIPDHLTSSLLNGSDVYMAVISGRGCSSIDSSTLDLVI